MFSFQIDHKIPGALGRAGTIKTPHGEIKTPAFMTVGTQGYVRFLKTEDLIAIGAQAMLSNGYAELPIKLPTKKDCLTGRAGLAPPSPILVVFKSCHLAPD